MRDGWQRGRGRAGMVHKMRQTAPTPSGAKPWSQCGTPLGDRRAQLQKMNRSANAHGCKRVQYSRGWRVRRRSGSAPGVGRGDTRARRPAATRATTATAAARANACGQTSMGAATTSEIGPWTLSFSFLFFDTAPRQNVESLGRLPCFSLKWLYDKMWKAWDGSQAGFFLFLFFWLGSGLYAAGGSPTEPDADSQTSFSFSFWI